MRPRVTANVLKPILKRVVVACVGEPRAGISGCRTLVIRGNLESDSAALISGVTRATIFISKATPGDDAFALWLAPRLEAAGYKVFADIRSLQAGDRWRREITETLQNDAIKMLLCCRDGTLERRGVQEENRHS